MNRHLEFDELQDFREGLLSPEEEESIRAHLERCPECRAELAVLEKLLGSMDQLPREARPSRDLWPQIHWRIEKEERAPAADVQRGRDPVLPAPLQVTLQAWQLMAASVAVAVISGGLVWALLSGGPERSEPVAGIRAEETLVHPVGWEAALVEYGKAISELEGVMERGREVLDPETVRIIEENLRIIDGAIRDAQEALAQDPGSKILARFLSENLARKVGLLRQVAETVIANT